MLLHLPPTPGHVSGQRVKNGPALAGHGAEEVRDAITRTITTLPEHLRQSLTWDQGAEMAQHAHLRIDTGIHVYFCDPHSPWQRGTNENTNGLLASTFPREPTSACMTPIPWRPSRSPSMRDLERPLAGKRPPRLWTNSSEPSIQGSRQRVLRRPLESAQFTSTVFTGLLTDNAIAISMDGRGAWRDNVFVERLWRSVKYEEIYLKAYDTVAEARNSLAGYFGFYNSRRPHSSLDRQTPDQAYFTPLPQIAAA